ncbi:type VII secretion-associated serine protease mycosin [Streptacidiphilus sp. PB12-B1b]|uniref:type VII secretion-associated serine protease mycosin n=1 Tax=Streptacidiphilus sp. PB12-B1b TaxID=2705012 RepID=UPI0015FA5344|nr:type VII secretion-associated serine protease mycosin [Streptacidiphilus sp. PB12-B1b]QMU78794.1 type VII secretion-associated serine protease mycosin [Streptacidiphilus sp. PB12-B1b]
MTRHHRSRGPALASVLAVLALGTAAPAPAAARASLDSSGQCTFPAANISGNPWALQRVLLPQLWHLATGKGVTVAVIDTGVSDTNPQLRGAVLAGHDFLGGQSGGSLTDPDGHGTMVAGIIAARPSAATGFVGLAPAATILSLRQNDAQGDGTPRTLAEAVDAAVDAGAGVINISQDVTSNGRPVAVAPDSDLARAVARAVSHNVVVVAAAGNEGLSVPTYPASLPGVLGVGASDRNDERDSDFSETGSSVDVAAPGVDMVSTVPGGGQCVDSGTSFAAPYAAAVAALLKQLHPGWTAAQIIARIEQTAQRTDPGRNAFIGWGVVDPVAAVSDTAPPASSAVPDRTTALAASVQPRPLGLGETEAAREQRTAVYILCLGALAVALTAGTAIVLRDARRRPTA